MLTRLLLFSMCSLKTSRFIIDFKKERFTFWMFTSIESSKTFIFFKGVMDKFQLCFWEAINFIFLEKLRHFSWTTLFHSEPFIPSLPINKRIFYYLGSKLYSFLLWTNKLLISSRDKDSSGLTRRLRR